NSIWNINGLNKGQLNANLDFTDMPNLLGGLAADVFAFQNGAFLTGKIDGGLGVNTLNYASYLNNVTVNLPLATATAVLNGISNIQNVTGSGKGNSLIVGDANPNVLVGGNGRNIIIGGAGADNITGGNDFN